MMLLALKYWREIALALLAVLIVAAGLYVRHVFADRDRLEQENRVLHVQLQSAADMAAMTAKVTEAISQIKIRSTINVSKIESAPKPVFAAGGPLPFIPGGVLQAVYSSAAVAPGAAPAAAPGGPLAAGLSPGGILH